MCDNDDGHMDDDDDDDSVSIPIFPNRRITGGTYSDMESCVINTPSNNFHLLLFLFLWVEKLFDNDFLLSPSRAQYSPKFRSSQI